MRTAYIITDLNVHDTWKATVKLLRMFPDYIFISRQLLYDPFKEIIPCAREWEEHLVVSCDAIVIIARDEAILVDKSLGFIDKVNIV